MKKAYVTIYFSMVLSVCMGLFSVLFTGVRENALRMRSREVMQVSIESAFGDYNRYIWEHYKLLFVDSGFESNTNSMIIAEDHFTDCMNKNFDEGGITILGSRDLLKLHCSGAEAEKIRFATDDGCSAIKHQAVEYMKYKTGIGYITDLYKSLLDVDDMVSGTDELSSKYEEAKEQLNDEDISAVFNEIDLSRDSVFTSSDGEISPFSLLNLVVKNTGKISTLEINEDALFGNREKNTGNYGTREGFSFADKVLLREYLLSVTSDYMKELEDSCLSYETEYLISGKDEDDRNLESVAYKILLIREALNYISFKNDEKKQQIVDFIASLIAILLENPDAKDPVGVIITTSWVSWESICDVKAIMNGGKRPLIKESNEWETDFNLNKLKKKDNTKTDTGLGYRDYLRLFLITVSDDRLMERFAGLIELNVRENTRLDEFRIDACFDAWEVTAYVESDYGYTYVLTRVGDIEDY